jgi:CubicO group peptidase (beta-lactamase class C family)
MRGTGYALAVRWQPKQNKRKRKIISEKYVIALVFFLLILVSCNVNQKSTDIVPVLGKQIDSMRAEFDFPAVAYGVIKNDSILALNAVGYRDIESKDKVEVSDYFHIGSCTKSFTAFLSGKLLDEGYIEWGTRFFELFPELKELSHPAYYDMTLKQLLSHRARIISFKEDEEVSTIIAEYEKNLPPNTSLAKRRYHCIAHILTYEPQDPDLPLSKLYSNAGFMAAGLMLEKVTNSTWESLIQEMSDELELDIHIGWPVQYNPDQPKGHINPQKWLLESDKNLIPIPKISMDYHWVKEFGLLTSPSGNISITVKGFLEYARLHLSGLKGNDNYLEADTYKTIFKSYPEYSLGWWVENHSENEQYGHRGSNGAFYGFIGINPKSNSGMVVLINTHKEPGLTDIIQLLANQFAI